MISCEGLKQLEDSSGVSIKLLPLKERVTYFNPLYYQTGEIRPVDSTDSLFESVNTPERHFPRPVLKRTHKSNERCFNGLIFCVLQFNGT